jgi:hypothetical protein
LKRKSDWIPPVGAVLDGLAIGNDTNIHQIRSARHLYTTCGHGSNLPATGERARIYFSSPDLATLYRVRVSGNSSTTTTATSWQATGYPFLLSIQITFRGTGGAMHCSAASIGHADQIALSTEIDPWSYAGCYRSISIFRRKVVMARIMAT